MKKYKVMLLVVLLTAELVGCTKNNPQDKESALDQTEILQDEEISTNVPTLDELVKNKPSDPSKFTSEHILLTSMNGISKIVGIGPDAKEMVGYKTYKVPENWIDTGRTDDSEVDVIWELPESELGMGFVELYMLPGYVGDPIEGGEHLKNENLKSLLQADKVHLDDTQEIEIDGEKWYIGTEYNKIGNSFRTVLYRLENTGNFSDSVIIGYHIGSANNISDNAQLYDQMISDLMRVMSSFSETKEREQ